MRLLVCLVLSFAAQAAFSVNIGAHLQVTCKQVAASSEAAVDVTVTGQTSAEVIGWDMASVPANYCELMNQYASFDLTITKPSWLILCLGFDVAASQGSQIVALIDPDGTVKSEHRVVSVNSLEECMAASNVTEQFW